ncbi:pyridoxamine 5'-phosphate oxidase family protein [Phytohabitans rumicis]|uniref:Pyridoxamine 5'-phosphate oxidase n=1 Tax=Phytohabitans rumicis TaxID=1076125 RepID=A0A6V8LJ21_9ACTN|nr:pyridoxamine 5'-phosphate oxidase family protein [Phytohabitans rumicis]GFJ94848.1 pyridoxamine 5'-phosphate oxidase [Phytohabitans rumicis]
MGSVLPEIDDRLRGWLLRQPMFFVATAPSGDGGHVNLSPKGGKGTLAVLGQQELAYVDLFGSGIETVAHLKQNGRITMMFCSFEGPPMIIRVHGRGEPVEMADPRFPDLLARFDLAEEARSSVRGIVRIDAARISDSCGFVVPVMAYQEERRQLYRTAEAWLEQRGPSAIRDYCDVNNEHSIDGLPGLSPFGGDIGEDQRARAAHEGRKL